MSGKVAICVKGGIYENLVAGMFARDDVPYGYKLTDGNVGIAGKKITLPHYMAMFL